MSWSKILTIPKGTTADQARDLIFDYPVLGNEDCLMERDKAVHFAAVVAADLLSDATLGSATSTAWEVNLSGHSNPGNEKHPEWSPDQIHIHVMQKPDEPAHELSAGEVGGGKS